MKRQFDSTDTYYIRITDGILKLAPVIGASAAVTFTAARLAGRFAFVEKVPLICFDLVCFSYFIAAYIFRKAGIIRDGKVSRKAIERIDVLLGTLVLLQWNLITYIFPARSFWGYAPMFVLLTAFTFHTKAVRTEIIGISVSIAVSWILKGESLLPYNDGLFIENLTLRIVALIISFGVIYLLTYFAERFTILVKEDFQSIEKQTDELETMGREIIDFTADLIEERDSTSGAHVKRLKTYTKILAEQLAKDCPEYGLTEDSIGQITLACVLHDVGKIAIPDNILLKPGRLTPEEFEVIKTHTILGARIIDKIPDSVGAEYKRYCKEICQYHHEKYDGRGYPAGLKGDEIPISAQIVSVVDCYDALSTERPYKSALPREVAINMILNGECGVFSDKMKACITACKDKLIRA